MGEALRDSQTRAQARRLRSLLAALLGVGITAASFALGFHFGEQHGKTLAAGEEHERLLAQLKRQREENARLRKELAKARALAKNAPVRTFGEDQLLFFEELPNEPVKPPPIPKPKPAAPAEQDQVARVIAAQAQPSSPYAAATQPQGVSHLPPASTATAKVWAVQVASFRKQEDAERLRAKLEKAQTPAFLRRVDLGAQGIWWRVYAGPFAARALAEKAREHLYRELGLRGFVARVQAR